MLHALDRIGDPSDAQVRGVPDELFPELWLDQDGAGELTLTLRLAHIWKRSPKLVWPLEALGS